MNITSLFHVQNHECSVLATSAVPGLTLPLLTVTSLILTGLIALAKGFSAALLACMIVATRLGFANSVRPERAAALSCKLLLLDKESMRAGLQLEAVRAHQLAVHTPQLPEKSLPCIYLWYAHV